MTGAAILEIDADAVRDPRQDGLSHYTLHPVPPHAIRLLRIEPISE